MKIHKWMTLSLLFGCAGAKYERGPARFTEALNDVRSEVLPGRKGEVVLALGIRAGSAHDPVGQEGLAWLTAKQIAHTDGLTRTIADMGGDFTVVIGAELVLFQLQVPDDKADQAVNALVEALAKPDFSKSVFEQNQSQATLWLESGLGSSPSRLAAAAFQNWIFQGHPYGHVSEGRLGILSSLEPDDVSRFYETRYVRPALAVVHTDNLTEAAAEALRMGLRSQPARLYRDVTPRPITPVRDVQIMAVLTEEDTSGVFLGHPIALRKTDPDWVALLMARSAIDASLSLDELIGSEMLQQTMTFWFAGDSGQSSESLVGDALSGISSWVSSGIESVQFDQTKARLLEQIGEVEREPKWQVKGAVEQILLPQTPSTTALKDSISALSLADVNAAIAKHIDPGALRVVVVDDQWNPPVDLDKNMGGTHIIQANGLFR